MLSLLKNLWQRASYIILNHPKSNCIICIFFILEKDFLVFFFKRLRLNESDRYADEFPYLSPCGRERNFIRCDDKPIVYTHLIENDSGETLLSYGGAGNAMTTEFLPSRICMLPNTGRVYHPAPAKVGGIGLIKSSLAIELSKYFEFENGEDNPPTLFTWKGEKLYLTNDLIALMDKSPLEIRELLSNSNKTWYCDCTVECQWRKISLLKVLQIFLLIYLHCICIICLNYLYMHAWTLF